jgi:hypothetical protein
MAMGCDWDFESCGRIVSEAPDVDLPDLRAPPSRLGNRRPPFPRLLGERGIAVWKSNGQAERPASRPVRSSLLLAVRVPPVVTVFTLRYLDDDLVVVGIEIVMAFLALSQHVKLLGCILPAVRVPLP